jgi:anti-anti-sigma factor
MDDPAFGTSRSLSWIVEDALPTMIVELRGTLDLTTAPVMRVALAKSLTAQPSSVIVDLGKVRVVEETCLLTLSVAAQEAATWPGCRLVVCGADPGVGSALHRMGIGRYLTVVATREEASELVAQEPPVRRYRERLLPLSSAASQGRRMCAELCEEWAAPEFTHRACVVVSELVSNAVKHARTPMILTLTTGERHLHIAVRDRSGAPPAPVEESERGGRGLLLIAGFSSSWGTAPTTDGKVVWAVLRRSRP